MTTDDSAARWREHLQASGACVPLERLDGPLTAEERGHVQRCVRCQTEFRVWQELQTPAAEHALDSAWVAAELRRRTAAGDRATERSTSAVAGAVGHRTRWSRRPVRALAAAAAIVLAVTALYLAGGREPVLHDDAAQDSALRARSLDVVEPVGDVEAAPALLRWEHAASASRYDVRLLEVDRTVIWRASSDTPRLALPKSVTAQFDRGKTVLWDIVARDASGEIVAESGLQQFRVRAAPPP